MSSKAMPDGHTEPSTETPRAAPAARQSQGILWAFTATTFLSALLLFSLQPMFAKMVLPVLGGSPSVWAVAMCFFQAALLAGYAYAHGLIKWLPARQSGFVHLAVYAFACFALPIALPAWYGEPPTGEPYLWQLGLFAVAVGLPFVAVAANAPLLQAWFAATGHPHGRDPYFLYAASNLGSLIALLGYPLVLEPEFGLRVLSALWTLGFLLLLACLAGLFLIVRRALKNETSAIAAPSTVTPSAARPDWRQRLQWIGLALIPSALLTAFTTHVTTDVASAPLLWVLPLALYLLTFVLVFRERALIPTKLLLAIHLVAVVAALLVMSQTRHEGWFVTAPVGVIVFFASAMVAHRTLYDARPAASHLTEFYLWMSFGGALGGLAAALIAPKLFSEVFEYPLLLALSMACRPGAMNWGLFGKRDTSAAAAVGAPKAGRDEWLAVWLVVALGLLLIFWVPWLLEKLPIVDEAGDAVGNASRAAWWITGPAAALRRLYVWITGWGATPIIVGSLAAVLLACWRRPPRQLAAAMMIVLAICLLPSNIKRGDAQRSYFGVYRVQLSADGQWNTLIHGTTLHGAQRVRDENGVPVADIAPATYYYEQSPMARAVVTVRDAAVAQGRKPRVGVIGLGTGSLGCHAAEGEPWRFFEIDPVIISIATQSDSFTFMQNCQPNADIVIGDARLTMAREADGSFDLIIVDAFSSDAVPIHLMTAEAIEMYLSKLRPDGVALLHISNRYLDLDAVLAATVKVVPGAHGLLVSDDSADGSYAQSTSTVALFSRSTAALDRFRETGTASEFDAAKMKPWTDDYSDIIAPFMSKYKRRFSD